MRVRDVVVSPRRPAGGRSRPPERGHEFVNGIGHIMTADVVCVHQDATAARLRELLVEGRQHCIPVVAPDGHAVGMVTKTDLLRSVGDDGESLEPRTFDDMTADEIMTPLVFALPMDASVERAAALMAYEGVEQLVVTCEGGGVAGVVRALDVARACARSAGYPVGAE